MTSSKTLTMLTSLDVLEGGGEVLRLAASEGIKQEEDGEAAGRILVGRMYI